MRSPRESRETSLLRFYMQISRMLCVGLVASLGVVFCLLFRPKLLHGPPKSTIHLAKDDGLTGEQIAAAFKAPGQKPVTTRPKKSRSQGKPLLSSLTNEEIMSALHQIYIPPDMTPNTKKYRVEMTGETPQALKVYKDLVNAPGYAHDREAQRLAFEMRKRGLIDVYVDGPPPAGVRPVHRNDSSNGGL